MSQELVSSNGASGKVAPVSLPVDPVDEGASGKSLTDLIQSRLLPDEFKSLRKLLQNDKWLKKASDTFEPIQAAIENGEDLTREQVYIVSTYSPLDSLASVKAFATDLKKHHEDKTRKAYFESFDA